MHPRKNEFECHVLVKAFVHSNEHLNLKNIQNDVFKIVLFRQKLTLSRQKNSKIKISALISDWNLVDMNAILQVISDIFGLELWFGYNTSGILVL